MSNIVDDESMPPVGEPLPDNSNDVADLVCEFISTLEKPQDGEFDDDLLLLDDSCFDFGDPSESVGEIVISTFQELENLVYGKGSLSDNTYVFSAPEIGKDWKLPGNSPRLSLDYLPVYLGTTDTNIKLSSDSLKAFKYASSLSDFNKRTTESAIDCFSKIDILNSGSLVSKKGNYLKLPYGDFEILEYGGSGQFNPLIIQRIVDVYCAETVFDRSEILRAIDKNLLERIYDCSNQFALSARLQKLQETAIVCFPELYSPEYSETMRSASELWTVLEHYFYRTVLPIIFLNDEFKSFVGCSLLSHEDFSDENYLRIAQAFIYYLCGCKDIARLFNTKSVDIASFDSKAIFGGKYSRVNKTKFDLLVERKSEDVKSKSIKETFAIDGDKRETVELTGLSVSSEAMQAFTNLCKKHPHFSPVFDYMLPFVESSFFNGTPLSFPPMLIAGPPGIGKTKFISELFAVFGYPISHCHSSQFTCGSGLVGLQSTWSNAQPGYASEALRKSKLFNPLIAFDELERIRMAYHGGNGISVEAAFMRLLEPLEASRFVDACAQMPHDVSKVNWIFTCNDPSIIPRALMTRLNKVCVYPPIDETIIDNVHRDIWLDLVNQYASGGLVKPWISADALHSLREAYYNDLNFRSGIKVMKNGLNKLMSGAQSSSYLTLEVIMSKSLKPTSYN